MNEPTITCPHCDKMIKLTETLAAPLLQEERHALEASRQKLLQRETSVKAAENQHKIRVEAAVEARREQIAREERDRAKKESKRTIGALETDLKEKNSTIQEMQGVELKLRKEREKLQEDRQAFDLKLQQAVDDAGQTIRDDTRKAGEAEYALKLAEKEKVIVDVRKQLDEARRKSDQGSQQLQGEVLERSLETMLRNAFPMDSIEPVPNGRNGGDVIQHVVSPNGHHCGTILWESKRTKQWSNQWLQKLRDDQYAIKADLAVIMSTALPEGLKIFGQMGGVWVTSIMFAMAGAGALRQTLVETAQTRQALEGHQDKQALVYDYLTSIGFRQRVEAIVHAVAGMQHDLNAEKRASQRQWAKREAHLQRLIFGTEGMYGDLQVIVGATLPEIEGMEVLALPPVEQEEEKLCLQCR